jgi:gamma-glutamylcysteine synthetase
MFEVIKRTFDVDVLFDINVSVIFATEGTIKIPRFSGRGVCKSQRRRDFRVVSCISLAKTVVNVSRLYICNRNSTEKNHKVKIKHSGTEK